ncbi:MAG: hypothetical protein JJT76_01210 [Clostridiaceae bacterium]|nr:hypothetical protein [Clostridiaceae bacterium]
MKFFCKEKHFEQWVEANKINKEGIFCLNIHEARIVAKMLFNVEDK